MAERLSPSMRDRLDALVAVGDDDPHSPLHRIKTGSTSPSVGGMKRLLARLELIEATGVLGQRQYQRILFHTVRTASADRVREMTAPRRHLALVCCLHQAWRDTVDMYGKLLDRNRKLVEARLDDMLKAQRARPSTGSFTATAGSARCCSTPTWATTSCGPDCCQPCRRRSCARTSPTS